MDKTTQNSQQWNLDPKKGEKKQPKESVPPTKDKKKS
jgi:hypothetical protein